MILQFYRAIIHAIKRIDASLTIFEKVLVANAAIITVGAVGGSWVVLALSPKYQILTIMLLLATGVTATVIVNFLILRLAFQPLFVLQRTINAVRGGNLECRAPIKTNDPAIRSLSETFNDMLNQIQTYQSYMSSKILSSLEDERKRIARELHDDTGQALTTLALNLELVGRELPPGAEAARQRLEAVRELASNMIDNIRNLISDLRPSVLDDLGLVPALRWYIKRTLQPIGITVTFDARNLEERLPSDIETALFRIVQEALTNVMKHAHATRVDVMIERTDGHVVASVDDNGQGFDPTPTPRWNAEGRGLGLFGMHERAMLLAGTVTINSRRGAGTHVYVDIPIPKEAKGNASPSPDNSRVAGR